jgi:hypothetical protein
MICLVRLSFHFSVAFLIAVAAKAKQHLQQLQIQKPICTLKNTTQQSLGTDALLLSLIVVLQDRSWACQVQSLSFVLLSEPVAVSRSVCVCVCVRGADIHQGPARSIKYLSRILFVKCVRKTNIIYTHVAI